MQRTCLDVGGWARNICTCFEHEHKTWLEINYLSWVWCMGGFTLHIVVEFWNEVLVLSPEFPLVSSLLWIRVYIDISPTCMLVESKCCKSFAFSCPVPLSGWRLWCFVLPLCWYRCRWQNFMNHVCAHHCTVASTRKDSGAVQTRWVVFHIHFPSSGPVYFICLPMAYVYLTGPWCLYSTLISCGILTGLHFWFSPVFFSMVIFNFPCMKI